MCAIMYILIAIVAIKANKATITGISIKSCISCISFIWKGLLEEIGDILYLEHFESSLMTDMLRVVFFLLCKCVHPVAFILL